MKSTQAEMMMELKNPIMQLENKGQSYQAEDRISEFKHKEENLDKIRKILKAQEMKIQEI